MSVKWIALNPRTRCTPGSSEAETLPIPCLCTSAAMAPSRDSMALEASNTTLPFNAASLAFATSAKFL